MATQATAAKPPLENIANKGATPGQSTDGLLIERPRNRRYRWRAGLWNVSTMPRLRACGRCRVSGASEVGVRLVDGRAGLAGLQSCGSVWACPVCSSKVMAARALEIGCAVAAAHAQGRSVVFSTLTMRHDRGQRLEMLWDALAVAWKCVTNGRGWRADKDTHGVLGYVRVVEVTIGVNGWHVHVHALLVLDHQPTPDRLEQLAGSMWGRWSMALQRQGLAAPLRVGSETHLVTDGNLAATRLGEYLAKAVEGRGAGNLGAELTQTQSKTAHGVHKTRPVWSLLDEGAIDGEADPLWLWHEWEKASKGRRQIAWSTNLRSLLGLDESERSDDEIAAEELGTRSDTVALIEAGGWASLVRRPWLIAEVLNVAEESGTAGLHAFLVEHLVEHRMV